MRKIAFSLLVIPAVVNALYIGSPAEPEIIEEGAFFPRNSFLALKLGYVGDVVFDRKLHAERDLHGAFSQSKFGSNVGTFTINARAYCEFYAFAGGMEGELAHRPSIDGRRRVYHTEDHFLWGAGARIIPFKWGNFFIGADAKIALARLPLRSATVDGTPVATHRAEFKFQEWQMGVGAAYPFELFFPYFTLTYSRCDSAFDRLPAALAPVSHFDVGSRTPFGLALGCSFSTCALFDLNIEVRLINEQAFGLAGNFQF